MGERASRVKRTSTNHEIRDRRKIKGLFQASGLFFERPAEATTLNAHARLQANLLDYSILRSESHGAIQSCHPPSVKRTRPKTAQLRVLKKPPLPSMPKCKSESRARPRTANYKHTDNIPQSPVTVKSQKSKSTLLKQRESNEQHQQQHEHNQQSGSNHGRYSNQQRQFKARRPDPSERNRQQ
jgi:hypothetical protein